MPRFLNTWTGEFEWHPDPNKVTYAILSHVWRKPEEGGEQSYDDVRRIQQEVKENCGVPASLDFNTNADSDTSMALAPLSFILLEDIDSTVPGIIFTHPELSYKIKDFCKVAREAGFRLAWNDACCIDKTSSAELSEAINSMYEWYRLSDMCYVYLADVSDDDVPQVSGSEFQESRWHRRGWTLQELIAPERIVFLTRTWHLLGTKMGLAKTLEKITGVDFGILTGRTTLDSVSVARRMSWAAWRRTTRVEDRAYSLLGIFGLHMSPIYGEGKNAFLRLQEEIIRTIPDQTIFAWGNSCSLRLSDKGEWSVEKFCEVFLQENHGLLASSPTSFSECPNIGPIASSSLSQVLRIKESHVPSVHCVFTPEGVNMRLICLPLSGVPDIRRAFQGPQSARDICAGCGESSEVDTVALLQCQERPETGITSILGLPLSRSRRAGDGSNQLRAFHIGSHFRDDDDGKNKWSYHTVRLEIRVLMKVLKHVRPTVKDVTLPRHYSGPLVPKSLQWSSAFPRLHFGDYSFSSYFRDAVYEISPHSTDGLRTLGIDPRPLQVSRWKQEIILEMRLAFDRDSGAGPTDVIALRLSITECSYHEVEANFSVRRVGIVGSGSGQSSIGAAAGTSHPAVVNTPHISGGFLDLDHPNDSHTIIPFDIADIGRRTIVHMEYTVQSEGMWGSRARLLRIALQHTFASPPNADLAPSNLWVSIDLSEMFPYVSRTESALDSPSSQQTGTDICERDSETSNGHDNVFPSCESSPLPVFADQEHAVYAGQDDFEALKEMSDALRAQIFCPSSQHSSRMQDMDQKMSAVVAPLDSLTRSQRLSINSCEHYDDDLVSSSAIPQIPVMHHPSKHGTMATLRTSPERSDNSISASAISLLGCEQAGPSDVPVEPQLGQKRPHEASPGAEFLGGSNAKRICQGPLYTSIPLADNASPQEHSDQPITGSETGQSGNDAGQDGSRHGPGTTADWTWSGSTGDGVTIASEPDVQKIQSSGQSEDSSTRRAVTTLPSLAKLDSVARQDAPESSDNTMRTVRDTVETLRRENDALRMQTSAMGAKIAVLEAKNEEVLSQNAKLSLQMADILNRLDTLAPSQGSNASRDGLL
ncbi:hypothetical protein VTO73DRAFT_12134 [Trametes versicolor]